MADSQQLQIAHAGNEFLAVLARTKNPKFREALERASKMTPEEMQADYEQRRQQERDMLRSTHIERLRLSSGMDVSDYKRTISAYNPKTDSEAKAKEKVAYAINVWPEKRISLYLHSPENEEERYGAGKSHLAVAYGLAVIEKGYRVRYWYMPNFCEGIRRSWSDEGYQTPCVAAKECDLLILDDIEKDHWEPHTNLYPRVLAVLEYRCKEGKPIVVTSNMSLKALGNTFGGNLADRLGMCKEIEVAGPSGRRNKQYA